jgi:hypothetical protein
MGILRRAWFLAFVSPLSGAVLQLLAPEVAEAGCQPPEIYDPSEVPLTKSEPNKRSAQLFPPDSRYAATEVPPLPGGGCPPGTHAGMNGVGCFDCGSDGFDPLTNECVDCPTGSSWAYGYCVEDCDPGEFFWLETFECIADCPSGYTFHYPWCVGPPPSSPPTWVMDLEDSVWRSIPEPEAGFLFDPGLGEWIRCQPNEIWISSIAQCCTFEVVCENQGKAGAEAIVRIPEDIAIRITQVTGVFECSDDGGVTWQPVAVNDVISGKTCRTGPNSSANWERDNSGGSGSQSAPPGGYVELLQGSLDIVQLGVCSIEAERCAAYASPGTALLREDFSLGEYVALEATRIDPNTLEVRNLAESGGTIDVWPGSPDGGGPVSTLQPGESITFGPAVPVAGGWGVVTLVGSLAAVGLWRGRVLRRGKRSPSVPPPS